MKRLDRKITNILNGSTSSADFIIADAKDADMAFGITAPGPQTGSCRHGYNESEGCWKTLAQYREQIRAVIEQELAGLLEGFEAHLSAPFRRDRCGTWRRAIGR